VITTADNVLLTAAAVRQVADRLAGGDDTVIALARKEDVLAAHPQGQRRFYRFRDGEFSNCSQPASTPTPSTSTNAGRWSSTR
jgi:hypothetical protein